MGLVYTKDQVEQIKALLQEQEHHQNRIMFIGLQVENIAEKVLRASGISDPEAKIEINPTDWSLMLKQSEKKSTEKHIGAPKAVKKQEK